MSNFQEEKDKILDQLMHYVTKADKFNGLSKVQASLALDELVKKYVIGEDEDNHYDPQGTAWHMENWCNTLRASQRQVLEEGKK